MIRSSVPFKGVITANFGQFSLDGVIWWGCRDVLNYKAYGLGAYGSFGPAVKKTDHDHFYMSPAMCDLVKIAEAKGRIEGFMTAVENQLELNTQDRLIFYDFENSPNVIKIDLSPFWRERICFDLLSILLRASINYYADENGHPGKILFSKKEDFWPVIEQCSYLTNTPALKKFLSGHTKVDYSKYSTWIGTFHKKPAPAEFLTKPE